MILARLKEVRQQKKNCVFSTCVIQAFQIKYIYIYTHTQKETKGGWKT